MDEYTKNREGNNEGGNDNESSMNENKNGIMEQSKGTGSEKRKNYIDKEDYFMGLAFLAAQRSKDPVTQVGACIVNEKDVVIGLGYNGFPAGVSDDDFPWSKDNDDPLMDKRTYVCHAELNAILNKNVADAKGCRLYVALFPCNECAKCIIQSGIKEVVYMSDKNHNQWSTIASKRMLDVAGVRYRQFQPKQKKIVIDFYSIGKGKGK